MNATETVVIRATYWDGASPPGTPQARPAEIAVNWFMRAPATKIKGVTFRMLALGAGQPELATGFSLRVPKGHLFARVKFWDKLKSSTFCGMLYLQGELE